MRFMCYTWVALFISSPIFMEKNIEVEYRALISGAVFEQLFEQGKTVYAESFSGPLYLKDAYFCPTTVKEFKEVEMDTVGSYSLRLREEKNAGVTKVNLNTKIITSYGDHNAWEEHETDVASYDESAAILKAIGFKTFFTLEKERYTYAHDEILVCLEKVKDFQSIIEVEIITTEDKKNDAKEKLLAFLASYGIGAESIVTKSVTNLLMKEKAVF